jgi:PTH1 family peptidyl-tRNA hydrolase
MKIIIGLGNPGKKLEKTRHNLGRVIVRDWQSVIGFSDFKLNKKLRTLISEGRLGKEKIILALPQTFMNLSGKAVRSLIRYYRLPATKILIVHDDIDLPLGKIKVSRGQGSAGHKGVQSMIDELKTKDFIRFRIGILPKRGKPRKTERFVLQKFNKSEEKIVVKTVEKAIKVIEMILKEGLEKTKQEFGI